MGSQSDLKVMKAAADFLEQMEIKFELTIVSTTDTERMVEYAKTARERGLKNHPQAQVAQHICQVWLPL